MTAENVIVYFGTCGCHFATLTKQLNILDLLCSLIFHVLTPDGHLKKKHFQTKGCLVNTVYNFSKNNGKREKLLHRFINLTHK
jgi:hypothetical protein